MPSPSRIGNIELRKLFGHDRITIARAISMVENELDGFEDLLKEVYLRTGKAYRVGITGPPGAGKSTITNRLARLYRQEGKNVGVIAVDPTSPFTGGALLGDRVRMSDLEMDDGIFIRSMASRGSLGGLSKKAMEAGDILDSAGCSVIIYETVGVGQSELDIAGAADTTVVVLVPESGDSIQAMKAGLMEIADFFVLNKADRAGADQAEMSLKMVLHFREDAGWNPDVLRSVASEGKGVEEILSKIDEHRRFLDGSGGLGRRRRARLENRIRALVADRLKVDFWTAERTDILRSRLDPVLEMRSTPHDLMQELVHHFKEKSD